MRSKLLTTTVAALLLGGASLAHAQDTGFYAGAAGLLDRLLKGSDPETRV